MSLSEGCSPGASQTSSTSNSLGAPGVARCQQDLKFLESSPTSFSLIFRSYPCLSVSQMRYSSRLPFKALCTLRAAKSINAISNLRGKVCRFNSASCMITRYKRVVFADEYKQSTWTIWLYQIFSIAKREPSRRPQA
jgi:hypothetical protein